MRRRQIGEHRKVVVAAQTIAQTLGLLRPHPPETWPQRGDQFHLVAMDDDALAQPVQRFDFGAGPIVRHRLLGATVALGQTFGDAIWWATTRVSATSANLT